MKLIRLRSGFANVVFGVGPNQFEAFSNTSRLSDKEFTDGGLIALGLFLLLLFMLAKQFLITFLVSKNVSSTLLLLGAFMAAFQRMLPIIPSSGAFKAYYAIPIWFAIDWMPHLSHNVLIDKC